MKSESINTKILYPFLSGLIKRAFGKSVNRSSSSRQGPIDLSNPTVADVCHTCELFQSLTNTLTQVRMDVIAGIVAIDFLNVWFTFGRSVNRVSSSGQGSHRSE